MKFSEAMIYYDYKMTNIARVLGLTKQTLLNWKRLDAIPYERQCQLEIATNGALKADRKVE